MIRIVSFKWRKSRKGYQLPGVVEYGPDHVNRHYAGFRRHLRMPFEYCCITDDPAGLAKGIRVIPLWDKCRDLGGCFNRLYVFSPDMREIIGPRFACVDLDCVLTGDVTPVFNRPIDFIINGYFPLPRGDNARDQRYNGGMFMMDAGARRQVWDSFDPLHSPAEIAARRGDVVGSDQAWIRLALGPDEARYGPADGVYEARKVNGSLPHDARIVFFAGKRDPSEMRYAWVRQHWTL